MPCRTARRAPNLLTGRMYYPIQVAGALLSIGDPHVSQGDGDQRKGVHGRIDKRCFPRWIGVPA